MSEYVTEKKFVVAEGDGGELYIFLTAKKTIPLRRKSFMTAKTMPFFCVTANKRSFWIISIPIFVTS